MYTKINTKHKSVQKTDGHSFNQSVSQSVGWLASKSVDQSVSKSVGQSGTKSMDIFLKIHCNLDEWAININTCMYYTHSFTHTLTHRLFSSSRRIISCLFQGGMDWSRFSSASSCLISSASRLARSAALRASICRFQSGMRLPALSISGTWSKNKIYLQILYIKTSKKFITLNTLCKCMQKWTCTVNHRSDTCLQN